MPSKIDKLTIDDLVEEKTAALNAIAKREALGKLIDTHVLSKPRGPQRWRAAVDLWINIGDMYVSDGLTASQENKIVIRQNKQKKNELKNKYAMMSDVNSVIKGGGDSDLREALNMPFGASLFIDLVDPEVRTKENTYKVMKAFPEYCIPESY